ncbi:MAG: leucyl aminopeptidase family protein [Actinomycetota bacterium]
MNRPIPKLGTRKTGSPSGETLKGITHLAIPVLPSGEISIAEKWRSFLESEFKLNFQDEISKAGSSFTSKLGEVVEISLLTKSNSLSRIYLVGVGERKPNELRKVGSLLGRKVKSTTATLLSLCADNESGALVHLNALALSTYTWSTKGVRDKEQKIETPILLIGGNFQEVVLKSEVLVGATWKTRDLIHTPSNIKSPEWIATKAKSEAKRMKLKIKVRSGRDLAEFGGLRAVGNSSKKNPPRFVEISYQPTGAARKPHVVLVGKGITFDTGGVSLKRPYDLMAPMKSDMAGAAAVLATVVAAAELKLKVKVTGLLMLAENALSATAQRPSDVIKHYGGTTTEVVNTDAEGRLVLADGLAYADKNLDPDYLIDIATLTGAATLGLGRQYGAMYTRDAKLARKFNELGEYIGDRIWHMPLVDDYIIALESHVADYNHIADKQKFQAGSVTAALFLEKFVGKRKWVHMDIAGPARSEADAGENPKGGTGFGVRLLTEWMASL